MADKKISQLTASTTPLAGTEVLPIVQSGVTKQVSIANVTAGREVRALAFTTTAGNVTVPSGFAISLRNTGVDASFRHVLSVDGPEYNGTGGHVFKTNGTERLKITSQNNGQVTVSTGNLVIGTAGKGIDFSADANAAGMTSELLDDYEEGAWTAVLSDGTNNATMAANTQSYVKVGSIVTLNGYVNTSSLGSVTGNLRITGIPFVPSYHAGGGVGFALNLNITAGQSVSLGMDANLNYINVFLSDVATGSSVMQASEWSSDGFIAFSLTYRTAT